MTKAEEEKKDDDIELLRNYVGLLTKHAKLQEDYIVLQSRLCDWKEQGR